MNPNLLEVVALAPKAKQSQLTLEELPVNRELAPYLISSMRSVTWVPHASKNNTVRAGVRHREGVEAELVAAVVEMGSEAQWGNVHPLTTEGISGALAHVANYVEVPLEILCNELTDLEGIEIPEHFQQTRAQWVPTDCVVVVPVDRSYLGTLWVVGNQVAALIHNVSRGMAVAWR